MSKEFVEQIKSICPNAMSKLAWIETSKGWDLLVTNLVKIIEYEIKALPEELKEQVYITQIKQKYGELRCYMSHSVPTIEGAISMAESMSQHICERCGNSGRKKSIGGWILVLCDHHYREEDKRENDRIRDDY